MSARLIPCPLCGEAKALYTLFVAKGNRGAEFIGQRHSVVLCKTCGLCFLNPQHEETDYVRYYELYDRPVRKRVGPKGFRPNSLRDEYDRLRLDFLTQFVPDKKSAIVDIGSGYGLFLKALSDRGYRNVHGCEPNREAARTVRENFGFEVFNAPLGDVSLPKGLFDAATLIAVIEHLTDPVESLENIATLLKPGGYFYVTTPNVRDLIFRKGKDNIFKFVHTFYFSEVSLKNILQKAGFEIVACFTLPAMRANSSLLYPENFSAGELNIIARKPVEERERAPVLAHEEWREVKKDIERAWRQDRVYDFSRRVVSFLRFRRPASYLVRFLDKKRVRANALAAVTVPKFVPHI